MTAINLLAHWYQTLRKNVVKKQCFEFGPKAVRHVPLKGAANSGIVIIHASQIKDKNAAGVIFLAANA